MTDDGIGGLCASVLDNFGREDVKLGQCKLIEKLAVKRTSVTKKGIRLALENLSNLKILECDCLFIVDALADMHEEAFEQQVLGVPNCSLTELNISPVLQYNVERNVYVSVFYSPYRSGSLRLAVALCPLITEVNIVLCDGLTDVELLQGLLTLKELRKLGIIVGISLETESLITFDGGVRPLLEGLGSSLTSLKLSGLDAINTGVIVEHCPNLRLLRIAYNKSYLSTERPFSTKRIKTEKPMLKKLEILTIVDNFFPNVELFVTISPEDLLLLLSSSPSLKQLSISNCQSLTDALLLDAIKIHGFQKLESIYLSDCPNVSKRGIDLFMNDGSVVSSIWLFSMPLLCQQNVDEWKAKAISNNWQLFLVCNNISIHRPSLFYNTHVSICFLPSCSSTNDGNNNLCSTSWNMFQQIQYTFSFFHCCARYFDAMVLLVIHNNKNN